MNRADYNVGNLESEIKVQFEQAVSALNQTITALDGVTSELKDVTSQLNILKSNTGLQDTAKQAENLKKNLSGTDKLLNVNSALKSTVKLGAIYGILRKGFNVVKDITMSNVDMIESTNLFEVSMEKVVDEYGNLNEAQSQYYTKAMAFQDKINEKFGTNKKELMEFQAKFNSLYANQGVDKKTSEWLSEQLIKAGYDISSLRNQDVSTVMDKLYSGITGQTKSIRDLGVDIGEGSITATLQRLGIDRTVNQLSYAEKEIARYITIVEQAKNAQGDFAKTFERPAQQIKVFQAQLIELKQVAGSFFTGLFGQIMPYVNGIIMAIKEVLKALGAVFGFEIDTGDSSLGAVDDTIGDIDEGLGGATKKAKEFKKQLMGFDEINNITPPSENGGGSGGGAVAGVDSALLNALKEWDNQMDSISGKAQEIRDKILDWLGVTDGSYENLKKILEIAKLIGTAISTWTIASTVSNFLKNWGKLSETQAFQLATGITLTITGLVAQFSGTSQLIDGNWSLFNLLETALGTAGGALGIVSIMKALKLGTKLNLGQKLAIGFGVMLEIQGLQVTYTAMEDLSKGITDVNTAFGKLAIGMGEAIGAGALLGAQFGGLKGAIVGGLLGALVNLTSALAGYKSELQLSLDVLDEQSKKHDEYIESRKKENEIIQENLNKGLAEQEYYKILAKELEGLVDVNGKVKTGYEDRVKFILNQLNEAYGTEYELVNGQIQKYKELRDNIYAIIKAEEARIIAEANEEKVSNAKQNLIKNQQMLREETEAYNNTLNTYNEKLKKLEEEYGSLENARNFAMTDNGLGWFVASDIDQLDKAKEEMDKFAQKMNETQEQIAQDNQTIIYWEDLKTATYEGDSQKIEEAIKNMSLMYETESANQQQTLLDQLNAEISLSNERKRIWEEEGIEINETRRQQLDAGISLVAEKLAQQTATIRELSPEQIEAWRLIAENSEAVYNQTISLIDEDTKLLLDTINGKVDTSTPDFIQRWQNMATNSHDEYEKALENMPEETRKLIEAINDQTSNITPENIQKWKTMASEDYKAYEEEMNRIEPKTRQAIEDLIGVVTEKTPAVERVSQELSDDMIASLENSPEARQQANKAIQEYMNGLSEPEQRRLLEQCGVNNVNAVIQNLKAGNMPEEIGVQIVRGLRTGLQNNYWQGQTLSTAFGFASRILRNLKSALGIASPSKKTKQYGIYLLEGFGIGINKESNSTLKTVSNFASNILTKFKKPLNNIKDTASNAFSNINIPDITRKLNKGIKINPKDFEVDTKQYVNYSAIKGQILAQSQVTMNENIADRIAEAVTQSMRNAEVNVNLNAKIQKGIMLETVQEEAREYTMQTGEPAFDY